MKAIFLRKLTQVKTENGEFLDLYRPETGRRTNLGDTSSIWTRRQKKPNLWNFIASIIKAGAGHRAIRWGARWEDATKVIVTRHCCSSPAEKCAPGASSWRILRAICVFFWVYLGLIEFYFVHFCVAFFDVAPPPPFQKIAFNFKCSLDRKPLSGLGGGGAGARRLQQRSWGKKNNSNNNKKTVLDLGGVDIFLPNHYN